MNHVLNERLLNLFRHKIHNPVVWRTVYQVIHSYSAADLQNPWAVSELVNWISAYLGVCITPQQKRNAVRWILAQHLNPHRHQDVRRIAALLYGA